MIRRMLMRVLRLAGPYKRRIQWAFVCSVLTVILSKMPIC